MNKKLVLLGIVVLVLLLGGGAYIMMNKSKAPAPATGNPTETAAPAAETQGTLKSLLAAGTQTCTFSDEKGSSGTVYVSNGKMRGDFTSTSQGQTVNGHMIIDSGYTYVWSDQMKQGVKMALTEGQASGSASNQAMDVNQTVTYKCTPWVADATKFTLPTGITFSTFTMPGAAAPSGTGATSTGAPGSACAACANLPAGPAQTACKTQLKCQ